MQTRLESLIEAFTNVWIGFGINFVASAVILPLVGLPVSVAQNLMIGFCMTFVSVSRTYLIRRVFDTKIRHLNQRLANRLRAWRGPTR